MLARFFLLNMFVEQTEFHKDFKTLFGGIGKKKKKLTNQFFNIIFP